MEKHFYKKTVLIFLIVVTVIILSGCVVVIPFPADTLRTTALSSINHCQDGRTIGNGQSTFGVSLTTGSAITSNVTKSNIKNTAFTNILTTNLFYQEAIKHNVDILCDINLSIPAIGGKAGFKYGLTKPTSKFALSLMPYVSYSTAIKSSSVNISSLSTNSLSASSNNISFEMNLPMSYYLSKDFSLLFGLSLTKNFYTVSSISSGYVERKEHNQFLSPTITLGLRMIRVYHEIKIDYTDNNFSLYYGISLKKKPKFGVMKK